MLATTKEMFQPRQRRLTSGKDPGAKGLLLLQMLLLLSTVSFAGRSKQVIPDTVVQEIRYMTPQATEVYLVWGLNNWNLIEESQYPSGTFVKDNLLYTPMQAIENGFSVKIEVPEKSIIDYVFWITKGPRNVGTDIWDKNTNNKDYHTYAAPNSIALVEPSVKIKPTQPLTVLEFALPVVILITLLIGVFIFVKRKYLHSENSPGIITYTVASGIVLFLSFLILRPSVSGLCWDIYCSPASNIPHMFSEAYYDFLFVFVLVLGFVLPMILLRKFRKVQMVFFCVFSFITLVSLIVGILNIRIVEMLGKPFNYQWLYYSDFLKSPDSQAALQANISSEYIINIVLFCISAAALTYLIASITSLLMLQKWPQRILVSTLLFFTAGYLFGGYKVTERAHLEYDRLSNPVTAFLQSVNPFAGHPSLFTMEVPDSLKYVVQKEKAPPLGIAAGGKIKNVIIYVLESTPAEYVQVYGSKFKATPELAKYSSNALVFENVYAHAPATNLSMVSLLGSIYPWLSYNSLTQEHPDLNISSITSELKQYGYRSGFFNSADNRFQRAGEFLTHRGFDAISDCENNTCGKKKFELDTEWEFMNGKDDDCTREEMMSWIKTEKNKPFFAMMWTYQTHYPYFFNGKQKDYKTGDSSLNKYLNALNHSDAVFGQMMAQLKKEKLLESTLVVVIGDHGEAFGRHGQISHGRMIYEENLHVPCMMINPAFKNIKNPAVGGMIDVSPTIMSLLGLQEPLEWQGESLLAERKNKRVYFFAPWSDYLFGYREGHQKYIYNATRNTTEIYDLSEDPEEQENLASYLPAEINLCHQRLAAWTQYVNASMEKTLSEKPKRQLAKR
jgi:lipoteichoic acid synthase